MSDPAVSIIIPCYRQAHFLPTALESVLAQSYQAIEPIVVNDGSDDETEEVAVRYGNRIRYIARENGGLPAARNTGIRAASGKYLLFLDSDDALHPEAVRWLVEAMEHHEDRLCCMGFRCFTDAPGDEDNRQRLPPADSREALEFLVFWNLGPPNCYLCSKSSVEKAGLFDEALRSSEDWDLWCRLVAGGAEVVPVRQFGAFYRRYPGSMSTNQLRMAQTRVHVRLQVLRELKRRPEFARRLGMEAWQMERILREGIRDELFDAGFLLRNQGEYGAAAVHYFRSLVDGGWNVKALAAIAKLLPHRLLRGRVPARKNEEVVA